MLSGETTVGAYPIEAVEIMDKIACTVEQSYEFREHMENIRVECFAEAHNPKEDLGIIMSRSGVDISSHVNAKAIVTPTLGGNTARFISSHRPHQPLLAVTPFERTMREMQLYWGVYPCKSSIVEETEGMIQNSMKIALESGLAAMSDKIVLIAGLPIHSPNMVNTVRVIILGTIIARSTLGGFSNPEVTRIHGRIVSADTPNDAYDKMHTSGGDILACRILTKDFIPILRMVKGVICEDVSELLDSDLQNISPNFVWLTHIEHTDEGLESGLSVTLDAKELLVYEGTV